MILSTFFDTVGPTLVAGGVGLLITALTLGFRHGFDWDHLAAIADITSTTATADAGTAVHVAAHGTPEHLHDHGHGGPAEIVAHDTGPGAATMAFVATPASALPAMGHRRITGEQRHSILLGTLYALGHATVVLALGLAALAFGAILPDWVDPIMARIVGFTLLVLGFWVLASLYRYFRYGDEFRLRSRWMLLFDAIRVGWRRFQARFHGHQHAEPVEMSSYGPMTAYGVGMIHGVGAETGTQVLLIAAIGGASGAGLGVPMLIAFIIGLLASNTLVVIISATGFVASQTRQRIYLAVGVVAGIFSIVVGTMFLLGSEGILPDLTSLLGAGL